MTDDAYEQMLTTSTPPISPSPPVSQAVNVRSSEGPLVLMSRQSCRTHLRSALHALVIRLRVHALASQEVGKRGAVRPRPAIDYTGRGTSPTAVQLVDVCMYHGVSRVHAGGRVVLDLHTAMSPRKQVTKDGVEPRRKGLRG
jgi:hypothetical protein